MLEEKIIKLLDNQKEIKKKLKERKINFMNTEIFIKDLVNEIEKVILEDTFEALEEPTILNNIFCDCGEIAKYKCNSNKTLNTGIADIDFKRRVYYCENCRKSIIPLDEAYGLVDVKGYSPLLTSKISYLASKMSYKESKETIKELLNIDISETAIQNQSEKFGKEVFALKFAYIPPINNKKINRVVIMADGGMLHIGKEEYKETRIGLILKIFEDKSFTVDKIGICDSSERFTKDFYNFCMLHGISKCNDITILGDGASWLDTMKQDYFPKAKRVIDYYHAKEYLVDALKEIYGEKWKENQKSEKFISMLKENGAIEIALELEEYIKKSDKTSAIYKAKRYYEKHYEEMNYKEQKSKGNPIGSGAIEGAVRHILHDRMGKSRSTWTVLDANAILILRAYIINGYWEFMKQKRYQQILRFKI